jgi:SAM-dependent methyltransferase
MSRNDRITQHLLAWLRRLRRDVAGWSVTDDRTFHESLFSASVHDPFSHSYPGNITIRRFADHAAKHVEVSQSVLDLGCGPGEITCELARRHPNVQFRGVDHSDAAIGQARALAKRHGLQNIEFEVADMALYAPRDPVDLVTMFDAFHHLVAPQQLIAALSPFSERFLLVEPAGDSLGRWRRTLDFDWIPTELDKIRARIEYQLGTQPDRVEPSRNAASLQGRAIENRYAQSDYETFFKGFGLEFTGTVAGLDSYPPNPTLESEWRTSLMDIAYHLLRDVDLHLSRLRMDLFAKHWIIYASRGSARCYPRSQERPRTVPTDRAEHSVTGAWDVAWSEVIVPKELVTDVELLIPLTVTNNSWRTWDSDADQPINLSYHWLDSRRSPVIYDGIRTRLPCRLEQATSTRASIAVRAPSRAGKYILQIDLVEEHVTWFSRAGAQPYETSIRVSGRPTAG